MSRDRGGDRQPASDMDVSDGGFQSGGAIVYVGSGGCSKDLALVCGKTGESFAEAIGRRIGASDSELN